MRLSRYKKDAIVLQILTRCKFDENINDLQERAKKVGDKLYGQLVTPADQKVLKSRPHWFRQFNFFKVVSDSKNIKGHWDNIQLSENKLMPPTVGNYGGSCINSSPLIYEDTPLLIEWTEIQDDIETLEKDKKALSQKIKQVLSPCQSIKRAIELLPEFKDILEKYEQGKTCSELSKIDNSEIIRLYEKYQK